MDLWVWVEAKQGEYTRFVMMDAADHLRLGNKKLSIASHGYAQTFYKGKVYLLHRQLLGLEIGDRRIGDHINGNKLDNRRSNLRIVDPSGSSQNVSGRGQSRFRGVHPSRNGHWVANVKFRGLTYHLGTFDNEVDAARVADAKRRELMPDYVLRDDDRVLLYGEADPSTFPLPTPTLRSSQLNPQIRSGEAA